MRNFSRTCFRVSRQFYNFSRDFLRKLLRIFSWLYVNNRVLFLGIIFVNWYVGFSSKNELSATEVQALKENVKELEGRLVQW